MEADGFILVKHSKKYKKNKYSAANSCEKITCSAVSKNSKSVHLNNKVSQPDAEKFCENIKLLEKEFFLSEFFSKFCFDTLQEHKLVTKTNQQTNNKQFSSCGVVAKIVCLGLGNFSSSKQSQYQLIFLR